MSDLAKDIYIATCLMIADQHAECVDGPDWYQCTAGDDLYEALVDYVRSHDV